MRVRCDQVTAAQFNACLNALSKSGQISRYRTNEIFKRLDGATKQGDIWVIPISTFWEYLKKNCNDVLEHRRITDPMQVIIDYTTEFMDGGDNWLGK